MTLYTIDQVAQLLAVSRSTVYRLIRRGELETLTVAGRKRVPENAIEALIEAGTRKEARR